MKKTTTIKKTVTETKNLLARYESMAELLQYATRSTQNALKMCATGDNFVNRLLVNMHGDAKTLAEILNTDENDNNILMSEYIEELTAETTEELEELAEKKDSIRKALNRVSTPNADRIILAQELENINYRIADLKGSMSDVEKLSERTLSDRQDCVQVWLMSYLYDEPSERIINSTINIMTRGNHTSFDLLENLGTVYHIASIRTAKNAVCRYVYGLGGINALDSTQTKTAEATAEAVTAWFNSGKTLDIKYPTAKQGTTYMLTVQDGEYVFKVTHSTFKQCNSIFIINDEGNETMIHSNNIAVFNQHDKERITKLMQCPILVERERMFIRKFMSRKAIADAQKARSEYFNSSLNLLKTNKGKFTKGLIKAEFDGRKKSALEQMYNSFPALKKSRNADKFFERLCDKLKTYNWEQLPQTAKTYDEIITDDFQYIMESPTAIKEPKTEHIDGLAWLTGKRVKTNSINWLDKTDLEQVEQSRLNCWNNSSIPEPTAEQAEQAEKLYQKKHSNDPHKAWSIDRTNTKKTHDINIADELAKAENFFSKYNK